jgi:predicted phage terminase large subunit-like protein
VISNAWRDRVASAKLRKALVETADQDGGDCYIVIPKDPGQAGKSQGEELTALLSGYKVYLEPQSGDKETRAEPLSAQVNAGNVDIVEAPWNEDFLHEMKFFPMGRFKDQIDAAASAFNYLSSKIRKGRKLPELHIASETVVNTADPNHG